MSNPISQTLFISPMVVRSLQRMLSLFGASLTFLGPIKHAVWFGIDSAVLIKPIDIHLPLEGINRSEWSKDSLFRDADNYLTSMSAAAVDTKLKVENILLHEVLPSLEEDSRKPEIHSIETYRILAKMGCCPDMSQAIVKHSLHVLLHLLIKDKVEPESARKIHEVSRRWNGYSLWL